MSARPESPTWSCNGYDPGPTAGSVTSTDVELAFSTAPILPPTTTEILPWKPEPIIVISVPPADETKLSNMDILRNKPHIASMLRPNKQNRGGGWGLNPRVDRLVTLGSPDFSYVMCSSAYYTQFCQVRKSCLGIVFFASDHILNTLWFTSVYFDFFLSCVFCGWICMHNT